MDVESDYKMKINEIITEDISANATDLQQDQIASFAGMSSMPDISMNKSNGNFYQQYRWMIATGLVGGKDDLQMPAAGAMAGDPVVVAYTDADFEKIKLAAEMTDAGRIVPLGSRKSMEADFVNKQSPHQARGPVALKSKKK
jgi:tagatose-1,6-bisphosphate aldolase non-catalytic subunit AgaZ/GatZ